MLGVLAEVVEGPNGNLKITRNGQTLVVHASRDKNVADIEEFMMLGYPAMTRRSEEVCLGMPACVDRWPIDRRTMHEDGWRGPKQEKPMRKPEPAQMAQQVAEAVMAFQLKTTGHEPKAVTVVLSKDTLVVTLHEALSPAERDTAKSPAGAAKVEEFHRQLFASSSQSLRHEIESITGVEVRQAVAEIEPTTGAVVQAFTSSAMVQVFRLSQSVPRGNWSSPDERD